VNAIELLELQHEEALELCRELAKSRIGSDRRERFRQLQIGLLAHMEIEEELFYPAAAKANPDNEPIVAAYENHASERGGLERCDKALKEDELFHVRIVVLREMLEQHMREERDELFPRARRDLTEAQLDVLGAQMEAGFIRAQKAASPAEKLNALSTSRELRVLSM
jgi:hypothetical protein